MPALKAPDRVVTRWKEAVGERRKFQDTLNTVSHFFVPSQANMWQGKTADRLTNPFGYLFDNTGVKAANSLANKAVSRVIPKNSQYADIKLAAPLAARLQPAERERWDGRLREFSDMLHAVLERGHFRGALKRATKDFLVLGHGAIKPTLSASGAIVFDHFPASSVFMENYAGREYSGCFWKRAMSVRNIREEYPFATLPTGHGYMDNDMKELVFGFLPGDGTYNEEFCFVENEEILIYHRAKLFGHERSIIAASYNNQGGAAYGEGFGIENLGEIQTLNQMRLDSLRSSKLQSTPMFLAANGALKNENVAARPGGIIKVEPDPAGGPITNGFTPLNIGGNPGVMFSAMEESRKHLKEGFGMMPTAADPSSRVRTATEWVIAQRQEAMENDETILALRDALVGPAIKQAMELLRQQGKVPDWLVVEDATFRLEMQGMEEESKQATDLAHLNAMWEMSRNIPDGMREALVPHAKMFRKVATIFKQEDVMPTTEEVNATMQAIAARQQAAQQQAQPAQ